MEERSRPPPPTAWLRLLHTRGINTRTLWTLLNHYPDPDHLLAAGPQELAHRMPNTGGLVNALEAARRTDVSADLEWLAAPDRHLLTRADPRFPPRLTEISDPPIALFVWGDACLLSRPQMAIVGSRNPTPYGREIAFELAHDLSARFAVTSGLAVGIDASAHAGALQAGGATLAVFGTGLGTVYPARHRVLAADIVARGGALVSEFPITTLPKRHHFPRRNRLISGLCVGTIVVEATMKSGSLITAYLAVDQNRDVFAVPGSIHSPLSAGCHHLIQQGAKLVCSVSDIVEDASPVEHGDPYYARGAPEQRLLDAMGFAPTTVDTLIRRTGLTAEQVSSMLLEMEVGGTISHCPGGDYIRLKRYKNAVE
ncbi:MAG: DNA-processing protein DprA [Gammaproteobacteria bacterium]|nr:DNA-processing protein DprA [Gammaproteobacteria bacterium]